MFIYLSIYIISLYDDLPPPLTVGGAAAWGLGQEAHPAHCRDHGAEEQAEGEEGEAHHCRQRRPSTPR